MRKDKNKAITWRQKGLSYNEISKKLGIPKSTLSGWFKNIKQLQTITVNNISKAKIQWAKNITAYNKQRAQLARRNWTIMRKKAARDIKKMSAKELRLVGTALYWAEGYRRGNWNVIFTNSDPIMIDMMMKFFLQVCKIPKKKIRAQIQTHSNVPIVTATRYWSKIIKMPISQFLKPIKQLSKSSKKLRKNSLPYGTLRIKINDVILVNKIKGWIIGLSKTTRLISAI